MTQRCPCGGDAQVDYFDHPKRGTEWFLRCQVCGAMSGTAKSAEQAAALVIEEVALCAQD